MAKTNETDGVWRTVGGRRIFIKTGQSLSDAMKQSGKFKKSKNRLHGPDSKEVQDINDRITKEWGSSELEDTKNALASVERYLEKHPDDEMMKKRAELHKKNIERLEKQESSKNTNDELKQKLEELRKDRKGLVYNLEEGFLKDKSDEEKLKMVNNELDSIKKDKERIAKIENEALEYQRQKHGEKAYQDMKKEFDKNEDDTFKKAKPESTNELSNELKKYVDNPDNVPTKEVDGTKWFNITQAQKDELQNYVDKIDSMSNEKFEKLSDKEKWEISSNLHNAERIIRNSVIKDDAKASSKEVPDAYKDSMITSRNDDEVIKDLNQRKEQLSNHKDRYTSEEYKKQEDGLNAGIKYAKQQKAKASANNEDSFKMYNSQYDKEVTVKKGADGKWVDSDGNKYMGYLSKDDVKKYFKGNWQESKETRSASQIISDQMSKTAKAQDETAKALGIKRDKENGWKTTAQLYKEQKGKDLVETAINSKDAKKYNDYVEKHYSWDDKNFSDRKAIDEYAKANNLDADSLYYMTKIASASDKQRLKKASESTKNSGDWVRNAFNDYKKQHPRSKMTLADFKKNSKK